MLGVTRVGTYDEAVRLVNENPYGNGTAIFTRDGGVARQFQFEVQAGMVGINVPIPVPVAYYSFGGWKASLFGDTHIYGPEGIDFYTRGKVVTSRVARPGDVEGGPGLPADPLGPVAGGRSTSRHVSDVAAGARWPRLLGTRRGRPLREPAQTPCRHDSLRCSAGRLQATAPSRGGWNRRACYERRRCRRPLSQARTAGSA